MTEQDQTMEERILRAVKSVLISVIKDTTTPPELKHPLRDETILDIRKCLELVTSRETELAQAAGRPMDKRPRYVDEPVSKVVVSLKDSGLEKGRKKD